MAERTLRVAAIQFQNRATIDEALVSAREVVGRAVERGARLVLLPEYFAAPTGVRPGTRESDLVARVGEIEAMLADVSAEHGVTVSGTSLDARNGGLQNVAFVYHAGSRIGAQAKVHPMPREESMGLVPGVDFHLMDAAGVKLGVLVCADVLYPEASRILSLDGVEVILNPVMSPYRGGDGEDPTRSARESVFVARAWDAAAFVVKAGVTSTDRRAVGRSLVAAPWGLLARYADEWTEEILIADLDRGALSAFRKTQRGLEARQPAAYRRLLD